MIREPSDLRRYLTKAVEFAAQLGTFYLSSYLIGLIGVALGKSDPAPWADVLTILISLAIGAVLPSILFASPTLTVRWQVDGLDARGRAQVDLRGRANGREFSFLLQSYAHYNSVMGWVILRSLAKKSRPVVVSFRPASSATRLKRQQSTGGAVLVGETIGLPTTSANQDSLQSMFFGSMVSVSAGSQYEFDAGANLGDVNRFTVWFVNVKTEVSSLRVIG